MPCFLEVFCYINRSKNMAPLGVLVGKEHVLAKGSMFTKTAEASRPKEFLVSKFWCPLLSPVRYLIKSLLHNLENKSKHVSIEGLQAAKNKTSQAGALKPKTKHLLVVWDGFSQKGFKQKKLRSSHETSSDLFDQESHLAKLARSSSSP